MKTPALIIAAVLALALAVPALAELQEIELPKVAAPAAPVAEAPLPAMFRMTPEGAMVAVDVLELRQIIADKSAVSEWTGFHPGMWWTNNVQPRVFVKRHPVGTLASVIGGTAGIAIADHNDWFQGGGGGSSRSASAVPATPALPTTVGGDVYYFTASGDGAAVVFSQTTSGAAAPAAAAE